jgi:AAA+ superfamily predicted ATPase
MKTRILNYFQAGYSGLYLVSYEEARVDGEVRSAVEAYNANVPDDAGFKLYTWSVTDGIIDVTDIDRPMKVAPAKDYDDTKDPMAMLATFDCLESKSVLIAHDLHLFLAETSPVLFRKMKDALLFGKASNRVLIITGCQLKLPPELEKEVTVIEFKLPDREQLRMVLSATAENARIEINGNSEPIIDAASGLTSKEAEDAFALAIIESGKSDIPPEIVAREKALTLKKNGMLEVVDTKLTLDDIGGLDYYKEHLNSIRGCFTQAARDYGLPSPRPVICVGQPGTAKSMSAMACKNVFNLPLLRLEAGRLFGSLVGQSEANWRTAFTTAKAIAPAILWIDEAEGLFSGLQSSGVTDGGTTGRVIKAILQDMQFNGEGLFFVFTANDVDQFPDPLVDRCDLWNFELPTTEERLAIWKIHIEKRGRKPKKFDLPRIAELTKGFSGRQIEQAWIKAMTLAFNDGGREPVTGDIEQALRRFVPTSVTMRDAIERRRQRLADRAQPASKAEVIVAATGRKLA